MIKHHTTLFGYSILGACLIGAGIGIYHGLKVNKQVGCACGGTGVGCCVIGDAKSTVMHGSQQSPISLSSGCTGSNCDAQIKEAELTSVEKTLGPRSSWISMQRTVETSDLVNTTNPSDPVRSTTTSSVEVTDKSGRPHRFYFTTST